jgi:photosystem II stability/assembly factor-like uncharacterized protein
MGVVTIVGTDKGAVILRSNDARERWEISDLLFRGWVVTSATRDAGGRYYVGATHEVYGAVVMLSDDLSSWRQIEKGPRYGPNDAGSEAHNLIIREAGSARHLDKIWKLYAAGDSVYAGVSEAGIFCSEDRGESWLPIAGLNDHADRANWIPGFGGLCAHSLLIDPSNPDRIWCGISAVGVLRSDDGGRTWAEKNVGVRGGEGHCVHGLTHDPNVPDTLYRQDHRGMYLSRDAGDQWELIENGLPMGELFGDMQAVFGFPIEFDPASGSVYAIPLEGDSYRFPHEGRLRVYRSRNEGASWEPLSEGLPDANVYTSILRGAVSLDQLDPCGVYFGTASGTLYASRDGGDAWQQIPCVLPRILCVEAFGD